MRVDPRNGSAIFVVKLVLAVKHKTIYTTNMLSPAHAGLVMPARWGFSTGCLDREGGWRWPNANWVPPIANAAKTEAIKYEVARLAGLLFKKGNFLSPPQWQAIQPFVLESTPELEAMWAPTKPLPKQRRPLKRQHPKSG